MSPFSKVSLVVLALTLGGIAAADDKPAMPVIPPLLDATALQDGHNGAPAVSPCDDFYQFACGAWLAATPIPSDRSSVSRQMSALEDATDIRLNQILVQYADANAVQTVPRTAYADKLANFYRSCMVPTSDQGPGLAELKKNLAAIDQISDAKNLASAVGLLHSLGADVFFGFGSGQDMNDATRVIGYVVQAGMALPDPDYYLSSDPKFAAIVAAYAAHLSRVFALAGIPQDGKNVVALENSLAGAAYSADDSQDPSKTNHLMTLDQLKALAPGFDWDTYFAARGFTAAGTLNVSEPEFLTRVSNLLTSLPLSTIKLYLEARYLDRAAGNLGGDFETENFAFYHQTLSGQKEPLPRWKQCTQAVENRLGYGLAEAYVKTFDGAAIKAKATEYTDLIKNQFATELKTLVSGPDAWLDESTFEAALAKLALLSRKIGAPEQFRNYDSLQSLPDSYLLNDEGVSLFENARDVAKIGKPVDKSEWGMMPWEINAYYDPSNNEFVFPFGILQPPSFDLSVNDGQNLGAFGGGTIGHELTHGFDKDGHQLDGYGNLKNWWTPQTSQLFDQKSQCYIDQANAYKVGQVGAFVKGTQTITENMADQGGVKLGYQALEQILSTRAEAPVWNGKYTERQQYWLSYAQGWCLKRTDSALLKLITSNVHPPEEFRVNGIVMNRPEFARDFSCKTGDRMAPAQRCSLW